MNASKRRREGGKKFSSSARVVSLDETRVVDRRQRVASRLCDDARGIKPKPRQSFTGDKVFMHFFNTSKSAPCLIPYFSLRSAHSAANSRQPPRPDCRLRKRTHIIPDLARIVTRVGGRLLTQVETGPVFKSTAGQWSTEAGIMMTPQWLAKWVHLQVCSRYGKLIALLLKDEHGQSRTAGFRRY